MIRAFTTTQYAGLDETSLHRFQIVQNAAACLMTGGKKHKHITPVLVFLIGFLFACKWIWSFCYWLWQFLNVWLVQVYVIILTSTPVRASFLRCSWIQTEILKWSDFCSCCSKTAPAYPYTFSLLKLPRFKSLYSRPISCLCLLIEAEFKLQLELMLF